MPARLADAARYLDRDWTLVAESKVAYLRHLRAPTWPSTSAFPRFCAVPRPTALGRTLLALEKALSGRRWYLFGAQALAVWGAPRTTSDVDVTVETADAGGRDLVLDLARQDLRLRVPPAEADAFVARTRVLPLLHARTRLGGGPRSERPRGRLGPHPRGPGVTRAAQAAGGSTYMSVLPIPRKPAAS